MIKNVFNLLRCLTFSPRITGVHCHVSHTSSSFSFQHDGRPYCHKPCYAALFGPKGAVHDVILIDFFFIQNDALPFSIIVNDSQA